jgi:hypothetical protein
MKWLLKKLEGNKTYLTAAAGALTNVAALANGDVTPLQFALILLGAGGIASVRAGVASEVKKLK